MDYETFQNRETTTTEPQHHGVRRQTTDDGLAWNARAIASDGRTRVKGVVFHRGESSGGDGSFVRSCVRACVCTFRLFV